MLKILSIFLPGIFVAVGVFGLLLRLYKKLRCTERVEAEVVDIVVRYDTDGVPAKTPVFCYYFNGIDYRRKSNFSAPLLRFELGEHVDLRIDSKKPERFYCPRETKHLVLLFMIFLGIGIFLLWIFHQTNI